MPDAITSLEYEKIYIWTHFRSSFVFFAQKCTMKMLYANPKICPRPLYFDDKLQDDPQDRIF